MTIKMNFNSEGERRVTFRLNQNYFYISMLLGILIMVYLASHDSHSILSEYALLSIVTYYVDPLIILYISSVILTYQIMEFLTHAKNPFYREKFKLIRYSILYFFLILFGVFLILVVSELISAALKIAFDYQRAAPFLQKGEPFLMKVFVGDVRTGGTSCPSGSVIRQLFIFMTYSLFINQNEGTLFFGKILQHFNKKKLALNNTLLGIQFFFLFFTCFSRIYRGEHSLFDVGVSLGAGIYLFWLCTLSILFIISTISKVKVRLFLTDMSYISFIYLPLFFFYSRSAVFWTLSAALVILALCAMYLVYENNNEMV